MKNKKIKKEISTYNLEAEQLVLGSLLANSKRFYEISDFLKPEHFYLENYKIIFQCICDLVNDKQPVDWVSIESYLERINKLSEIGGTGCLTKLLDDSWNKTASSTKAKFYAKVVYDKFIEREILRNSEDTIKARQDGDMKKINKLRSEFIRLTDMQNIESEETDIEYIEAEFEQLKSEYAEKIKSGERYIGIPTGFETVDNYTSGLRKGHLFVIGAYSSVGKTFAMTNIVSNIIKNSQKKKKIVVFSLEMNRVDIYNRILSSISGMDVNINRIFTEQENQEISNTQKIIRKHNLILKSDIRNVNQLKSFIMRNKDADLLALDYLQLLKGNKKKDYEDLKESILTIQSVCKDVQIPIIVLSQMNNESVKNPSELIGLKGAGDIVAAADLIIELKRKDKQEKLSEMRLKNKPYNIDWIIRKNRHGPIGTIPMYFHHNKSCIYTEKTNEEIKNENKEKEKKLTVSEF